MARSDDKGSDKGKVKVRVIEFEMEGSNQTLRDSIRDIVGAIGKAPTIIRVPTTAALSAPPSRGNGEDSEPAEYEEVVEAEENGSTEETSSARPRKPTKPRTPQIVPVELRGGDVPLRTFLAKAPDTIDKRYVLIAYWYKAYRQMNEVSQDHIYTAYKEMTWTNFPKDVGQPLRALKADGWFDKGSGGGAYALNHVGDGRAVDLIKEMGLTVE